MAGHPRKKLDLALGSLCAIGLALCSGASAQLWQENAPVAGVLEANPSPSARADVLAPQQDTRPEVAIVIDDLGLDWERFQAVNRLPVPVTLAFLPYGTDAQAMLDTADGRHSTILHMPMEPKRRKHHAGPGMVKAGKPAAIRNAVHAQLNQLSGYRGVNNHTGSAITENKSAMATVLATLQGEGLYFLDSKTTPDSRAAEAGAPFGALVLEADLFLDGDFGRGGRAHVQRQLKLLEATARRNGSAIGIGHPYPTTIAALNDWAAEKRLALHFVTTDELADEARANLPKVGF